MKSILIVTEQFTIGGLETHIRGEISRLCEGGIEVHLAVGKIFEDLLLPTSLASVSHSLSLDPGSTPEGLLTAINQLRKIIREHSIDGVHIHPFTSIIPAVAAAELERIPYAITLHGPASLASYGAIYDLLIKDVILPNTGLIVAVSPEVQRLLSVHATDESVICIPNAVLFSEFSDTLSTVNSIDQRWLVISRLDQFKIPGIIDFCSKAKRCEIPGVLIVGDGPAKEDLRQMLEEYGLSGYATLVGVSTDVPSLIQKYAGVAGMGRVVLEGVMYRKPVVLVGYDGVKGVVDVDLLAHAAKTNFSGRELSTIDAECLHMELRNKSCEANVSAVFNAAKVAFNDKDAWIHFLDQMRLLSTPKPTILTGLYHSLFDSPIVGTAPYLYSQEVLDRLESISCSINFYDPRLLAALSLCRQRIKSMCTNQVVAERDGQISVLKQIVTKRDEQNASLTQSIAERDEQNASLTQSIAERDEQNASLTQSIAERDEQNASLTQSIAERDGKIQSVLSTYSWRMTLPLRLINRLGQAIASQERRYALLKSVYWRLPEQLRHQLNRQRHAYVARRLHHNFALNQGGDHSSVLHAMEQREWLVRANQAERIAIIPCGFEFDELVNQRPINAAKYFAAQGYLVLFVAWQWTPNDKLSKGCGEVWPNVYQVPLFDFVSKAEMLRQPREFSLFLVTMPAPTLVDLIPSLRQRGLAIVYDIMDEWEAFFHVGQAPWFKKSIEDSLVLQSDYVCAVSPSLRDKFAALRLDISVIGNGYTPDVIGVEHKGVAGTQRSDERVIGYFGHLTDAWFDWRQVFHLAKIRTDLTFEIIGYGEPDWVRQESAALPNLRLLGKVLPDDLHRYTSRWSAGIIPFVEGVLAEAVDPIKIYEYLYFGLPVIVTGIRHLKDYPMTYFAERKNILDTLEQALESKRKPEEVDAFLERTTWRARFDTLVSELNKNQNMQRLYAN